MPVRTHLLIALVFDYNSIFVGIKARSTRDYVVIGGRLELHRDLLFPSQRIK